MKSLRCMEMIFQKSRHFSIAGIVSKTIDVYNIREKGGAYDRFRLQCTGT